MVSGYYQNFTSQKTKNSLLYSAYDHEISLIFQYGPIAQRLEQSAHNREVPGSNPGGPTILK